MSDGPERNPDPLGLARSVVQGLAGKTPLRRRRALSQFRSVSLAPLFSGAKEDTRDPQTLDKVLANLVQESGWSDNMRVQAVFTRWAVIVGNDIAAHAQPIALTDGCLDVRTDTTAWATQLRLLAPELVLRLNNELGEGTVLRLDIRGPHAPSWSKGKFRVKGRGPRDTYG